MKNLLVSIALLACAAFAQTPTNQSDGPPPAAFVKLLDYNSTYLIYVGIATQFQQPSLLCSNLGATCRKRSDSTLTSIAVSANVATVTCSTVCGMWKGQRVTVTGATVDTDLNGTYTVTSDTNTSATTYTFTTASVANATYTEATLQVSTNMPLTTQAVWAIQAMKYDGSNNLIASEWANGSVGMALAYSNRTTY